MVVAAVSNDEETVEAQLMHLGNIVGLRTDAVRATALASCYIALRRSSCLGPRRVTVAYAYGCDEQLLQPALRVRGRTTRGKNNFIRAHAVDWVRLV